MTGKVDQTKNDVHSTHFKRYFWRGKGMREATILLSPIYFSSSTSTHTAENHQEIDTGTKLII